MSEITVMRDALNSLCDDLQNGEHVDMDWIRSAIEDAAHSTVVKAFAKSNKQLQQQLETAKSVIKKQREGIDRYSDMRNWQIDDHDDYAPVGSRRKIIISDTTETLNNVGKFIPIGGHLARQIKQETEKQIKELLGE